MVLELDMELELVMVLELDMELELVMALALDMVLESAMALALAMRLWVMLWLRCTLTRFPPTPTSMQWPTTTQELALMLQRRTMALLPGRAPTLSIFLTAASSMSTTTPTILTDTWLR